MPDNPLVSPILTPNPIPVVPNQSNQDLNQITNKPAKNSKKIIIWLVIAVLVIILVSIIAYTYVLFTAKSPTNISNKASKNAKSDNTYQVIQTKLKAVLK